MISSRHIPPRPHSAEAAHTRSVRAGRMTIPRLSKIAGNRRGLVKLLAPQLHYYWT